MADVSPAPALSEGQQRFAKILAAAEDVPAQQFSAKGHDEPAHASHRSRPARHVNEARHRKHAHQRVARAEGFMAFGD